MAEPLQARIAAALSKVVNPRLGQDVMTADMIRDIGVTLDGKVRFSILLAAQDPASLVREVRQAVEQVDGVTDVRVDVKTPLQGASAPQSAPPKPAHSRQLPVMNAEPQSRHAHAPSAPQPVAYPNLGRVIAISSGKGGVGKSTVATNLAIALAESGARVGLMDADIYGPNIPRMMGINVPPPVINNRIMPLEVHGVKLMSLGFLIERDQPAIWRGPIVMKIITQFLRDVEWGELD
ncbi:MAG TPA: P-loop NTPase, partial [Gemmatimonadaceae bacterium]|nr:P-loop NTPase [Gemmatimonadaceae bacterium]